MWLQNVTAQMIDWVLPGEVREFDEVKYPKIRQSPAVKAGYFKEVQKGERLPMPTPRVPDLSELTISRAIAVVKSETSLEALGKMAQQENRPKVVDAIEERASELSEVSE